jgi:flavodoxin
MKSIIICASTHHGNTRKVVDAIAEKFGVEVVDSTVVTAKDLSDYDLIGFASGIYAANFHPSIQRFAENNLPKDKKIFYIMTSAMDKDFSKSMAGSIAGKNAECLGVFSCKGYNTFGPFKLVGGTAKGRPNEEDLAAACKFYEDIVAKL